MKTLKFALPAFVLVSGMLAISTVSSAKPSYSGKEKKSCEFCHTAKGKKELNDAGKYYKDHNHSLAGYKAAK
jgi:hypothetical protein